MLTLACQLDELPRRWTPSKCSSVACAPFFKAAILPLVPVPSKKAQQQHVVNYTARSVMWWVTQDIKSW
jgi:hypothetical protein